MSSSRRHFGLPSGFAGPEPAAGSPAHRAFTLTELLVVVAVIAVLAGLLLPALQRATAKGRQAWCLGNLREIGVALHSFAHEHDDAFPPQVSTNQGGSRELNATPPALAGEIGTAPWPFRALSNHLADPRVVACPSTRARPTRFATLTAEEAGYFIALRASYRQPDSLLAGDDNVLALAPMDPAGTGDAAAIHLRWTVERHGETGDLLFSDGHAAPRHELALTGSSGVLSGEPTAVPPAP